MTIIKNEADLLAYLKGFPVEFSELKDVVYLDATGDTFEQRLSNYFSNSYKGVALFLGLFDGVYEDTGGYSRYTFQGQLTVLKKHDKTKPDELIGVRQATRELLLRILGKMKTDADEARQEDFVNEYSVNVWMNKFYPVSKPANVDAYGFSIDFDLTVAVNDIMF